MTHGASATIEKVDVQRAVSPDFGKESTVGVIVTFSYRIDEHAYERRIALDPAESARFAPWGQAKVCYDPEDIKTIDNARLFPAGYSCGS